MKLLITLLLITSLINLVTPQENGSSYDYVVNENPITTHILDTSRGRPAERILVKLYKNTGKHDHDWIYINQTWADTDGRVGNLISGVEFTPSIYKLYFDSRGYFGSLGQQTFYPFLEISFEIRDLREHYHVAILLNPYGFSSYRGS